MARISFICTLGLASFHAAAARGLSYSLAGGSESWPADRRAAIVSAMDTAVALYNDHGYFPKHLVANDNPGVPTAQANYDGWIDFGGQIGARTALHEIAHTLGVGTHWNWSPHLAGGVWTGAHALARVRLYDGGGAALHGDGSHFWPYGLNFENEDGAQNRVRHIRIVAALRRDMGIVEDGDGDGLPDDWEQFWFGGTAQTAAADPDRDGVNNLQEYQRDTEPLEDPPPGTGGIAHYAFGGNTRDSSGGTNHGVPVGTPSFVRGPVGQAIDLDGLGDYVALPANLGDAADFTAAAWIHWDGGPAWQRIIDLGSGTDRYMFLTPKSASGTLRFAISIEGFGNEQRLETSSPPTGRWTHVAVRLRGNTGTLFVNGTAEDSGSITLNPSQLHTRHNFVGRSQFPDPFYNGRIDELQIHDRALTDAEIASLSIQLRRGDCKLDGVVDITDAIFSLGAIFLGTELPPCGDACDANDDGGVDISDPIITLGVLFLGQEVLPPPGMLQCGIDPTEDELGCRGPTPCEAE